MQKIAGRFAFCPEPLFAPAKERDDAFGLGFLVGFLVHVAQHQHLAGLVVLNNNGNQPIGGFIEIDCHYKYFLTA